MEKRRLGQSDLSLAPLMLGGNVFGWTIDQRTSFGILDAFIDAGFNAVDASDSYARWVPGSPGGESETIIGNWLKRSSKRDKVMIATKVGEDMGEGRCLKKDYILHECEASLRRPQGVRNPIRAGLPAGETRCNQLLFARRGVLDRQIPFPRRRRQASRARRTAQTLSRCARHGYLAGT